MNLSFWKCLMIGSILLLAIESSVMLFAQGSPAPAATPPAKTKPTDPPAKIALTDEEGKDLEISLLKAQNLDLQIEKVQNQILSERRKLSEETVALSDKFAKAHNVDLKAYRLDPQQKAFVKIPPPTAAKGAEPKH